MEIDKKKYEEYVKQVTPTHSLAKNMAAAFLVGGIICVLGQFALNFMMNNMGMDQETAAAWTLLELILLSILLTGFNIYPKIVKFGGAGALVPITGFANSVVAPAIEFHAEGEVFGVGCKIYHCRAGDFVRGFDQLGLGADLLGWQMDGDFLIGS